MRSEPIVFVVDDDSDLRDSLVAMISSRGLATRSYASAEEFLDDFDPLWHGCLVADMRMTGISGLELQQRLLQQQISLPVIIITGYGDVPSATTAMRHGAVTFLQKPCPEQELWESICTVLDQDRQHLEEETRLEELRGRFSRLTPQEHQVLEKLIVGTPNKVIAAQLEIGLRTVELRRANVMKKLEARSLAELVRLNMEANQYAELLV